MGKIDKQKIILLYLFNFFKVIYIDYDEYYLKLLKNALKYGMSRNDFWNNDSREYYEYQEAYIERLHETSHIQGHYNFIALTVAISNMFIKKGSKPNEYPTMNEYSQIQENALKNAYNGYKDSNMNNNIKREKINRKKLQNLY